MFAAIASAVLWASQTAAGAMDEPKYSIPRPVIEQPFDISKSAKPEPTVPVSKPKK